MISKSLYIRALQCPKSLWLYKNRPELREVEEKETLFNRGYEVGDLAKNYLTEGLKLNLIPMILEV